MWWMFLLLMFYRCIKVAVLMFLCGFAAVPFGFAGSLVCFLVFFHRPILRAMQDQARVEYVDPEDPNNRFMVHMDTTAPAHVQAKQFYENVVARKLMIMVFGIAIVVGGIRECMRGAVNAKDWMDRKANQVIYQLPDAPRPRRPAPRDESRGERETLEPIPFEDLDEAPDQDTERWI
jgi:hypothetical protein